LAGFEPAAVIVEILNEDGTMARRPDLEKFAAEHGIKLGTIADLIEYRNQNETTIEPVAQCQLPTEYGEFELFTFRDVIDNQLHYALKKLPDDENQLPLVRVHLHDYFGDALLSMNHAQSAWPLHKAMKRIADEGGVLVILGNEGGAVEQLQRIQRFAALERGEQPVLAKRDPEATRRVGVGSQILKAMGVTRMRLLSSQKRYHALSGFGLEVVEYLAD
jgi:3,4-dihydroxy 2-butanone 4-phosphate synthase/GTP cyclohydrolase II